jgi:hypothetical protein
MWGCTKGGPANSSSASQTCAQVMGYLTAHNVPRFASHSGVDRLMHGLLWQIAGMFVGFEKQGTQNMPFPGFEFKTGE